MREEPLTGGNASGPVVRVGDTVRKAWAASTPSVIAYLDALRASGIDVPRHEGRDAAGRQALEYVPGPMAMELGRLERADLARVGALVRSIHDASAAFVPAPGAVWQTAIAAPGDDLVCHNDLAPWNLVVGERWVFIDWDAAAPSTRLWDLAYAAQSFALGDPDRDAEAAGEDVRAFADGYRADAHMRSALPEAMVRRVAAMVRLLERSAVDGLEPWATMHAAGHGDHWRRVLRFVRAHREVWAAALRCEHGRS